MKMSERHSILTERMEHPSKPVFSTNRYGRVCKKLEMKEIHLKEADRTVTSLRSERGACG